MRSMPRLTSVSACFLADDGGQPGGDFYATLGRFPRRSRGLARDYVRGSAPAFGLRPLRTAVANVFAVAKRGFSEQATVRSVHCHLL